MEFLPLLNIFSLLTVFCIVVLFKLSANDLISILEGKNFFLLATLIIIFLLLAFYLYDNKQQQWIADVLKIAVGVFVGAGTITKSQSYGNFTSLKNSSFGDKNKIAGRDINETIQNIDKAFNEIKDSIVTQNSQINQVIAESATSDYLINIIYERNEHIGEAIERIIGYWVERGWTFKTFSSDYAGVDGLFLFFTRVSKFETPQVYYHKGSDINRFIR
jgi:hypothetical protein